MNFVHTVFLATALLLLTAPATAKSASDLCSSQSAIFAKAKAEEQKINNHAQKEVSRLNAEIEKHLQDIAALVSKLEENRKKLQSVINRRVHNLETHAEFVKEKRGIDNLIDALFLSIEAIEHSIVSEVRKRNNISARAEKQKERIIKEITKKCLRGK